MYDFPPYRPPSEAHSALIRVSRGCPWTHCTFCGMYKETLTQDRDINDIKADIKDAPFLFPSAKTVFIGDSDPLTHKQIHSVLTHIKKAFPAIDRITTYARAFTLAKTAINDLIKLRKSGLTRVHVGLESGDPIILKKIKKGYTPTLIAKGAHNAKSSGLELCFYVLCGIGGDNRWQSHALKTARIINQIQPHFIRLRTLTLVANSPLFNTYQEGNFTPISPLNRLRETQLMIGELNIEGCRLESDHITNNLWSSEGIVYQGVSGQLPEDTETMLHQLTEAIQTIDGREDIVDANHLLQQGLIGNL